MDKYEVRYEFDRLPKIVKFSAVEAAKRFYDKVKATARKNNTHCKVALWKNGWLEYGEEF